MTRQSVLARNLTPGIQGSKEVLLTPTDVNSQASHGFVNRTDSTISFVTGTRVFTIQPAASSYQFYNQGVVFTKAAPLTLTIPNTTQVNFVYFDSTGTLVQSTTAWDLSVDNPVALIYWNATLGNGFMTEERHMDVMDWSTHYYLHNVFGTQAISGFGAANYTLQPATASNTTNQFSIALGVAADEDIDFNNSGVPAAGPYTVFYRTGATGVWTFDTTPTLPFKNGATYIQANTIVTSNWQLTDLTSGQFVNYYVFATTSVTGAFQIILVPGQAIYSTLAAAQAESPSSVSLTGLPFVEFVLLYQVTWGTGNNAHYTGATGQCLIEAFTKYSLSRSGLSTQLQVIALTGDVTGSGTSSIPTNVYAIHTQVVSGVTGTVNVVFSNAPTITGVANFDDVVVGGSGILDHGTLTVTNIEGNYVTLTVPLASDAVLSSDVNISVTASVDFQSFTTAVTQATSDNSTFVATTAFVKANTVTRLAVADTSPTITGANDRIVAYTSLSAARAPVLPAANGRAGQTILLVDESGSCSATNTISLTCGGSDTFDSGQTTVAVSAPYGSLKVESNGVSKWTVIRTRLRSITFTGNGTWVAPAGIYYAHVLATGGGGGGGGASAATYAGAGGGGGQVVQGWYPVTPGTSYSITIGTAGTAGASGGGNGGNGGSTTFGAVVTAVGGGGGSYGSSAVASNFYVMYPGAYGTQTICMVLGSSTGSVIAPGYGQGGVGGLNAVTSPGAAGGAAYGQGGGGGSSTGGHPGGGGGGGSYGAGGAGGAGTTGGGAGTSAAANTGGGGGGAGSGGNQAGGAGGTGICIVSWLE